MATKLSVKLSMLCQGRSPMTRKRGKSMRRKRFQRGSLTTRKRSGKSYWFAQWREEGRPRTKEIGLCSKMTKITAEGILQDILKPVNEGVERSVSKELTFESFVELTYLPVYKGKWKNSTAMTEENRIQVHLVGTLGEKRMRSITREQLQELLECKAKQCGHSMVDHMRFRLRSIFELAMSERVVEFNPARSLFTPRKCQPGRPRRVLTPCQAGALVQLLGPREGVIARLATWEGMRPGEILALRVSDLDGDSLWVKRRLYKGELDDPKNDRSARQVALTLGTKTLLELWVQTLSKGSDSDWLFPSENGTPIRRENLWPRYILPKLEPADLLWATFQVMRRSFATWAKKAGVDAHTRSAQMGNTVDVNENEYAVATFEQKLAAIRRLEKAIRE
jgi:integrase